MRAGRLNVVTGLVILVGLVLCSIARAFLDERLHNSEWLGLLAFSLALGSGALFIHIKLNRHEEAQHNAGKRSEKDK